MNQPGYEGDDPKSRYEIVTKLTTNYEILCKDRVYIRNTELLGGYLQLRQGTELGPDFWHEGWAFKVL
jgi:hypothetical protein